MPPTSYTIGFTIHEARNLATKGGVPVDPVSSFEFEIDELFIISVGGRKMLWPGVHNTNQKVTIDKNRLIKIINKLSNGCGSMFLKLNQPLWECLSYS